jgi:hypothetical protein
MNGYRLRLPSICTLLLAAGFTFIAGQSSASVLRVPSEYVSIQDAINVALEGDTVLVADGEYTGDGFRNLRFLTKNIALISESGSENTVLDFGSDSLTANSGIILGDWQTAASMIKGFTLRGGATGVMSAAALGCHGASPRVMDCVFSENKGSIIILESSTATFTNCTIVNNEGMPYGAIRCWSSMPVFDNCLIAYNTGGPAFYFQGGASDPVLSCCLIYGNEGGDWTEAISGQANMSGNMHVDPKLCDFVTRDYHLQEDSPCRPDADSCGLVGAMGVGCTSGVSPFADNLTVSPLDSNGHVYSAAPVFTWDYADTGSSVQQGYIVQVLADADTSGEVCWADTSLSSDQHQVDYGGAALNSHATYYVRVQLSDAYGSGPWREATFFTHLSSSFFVPTSQPTIQDGLNVAFTGDTIVVKDGVYKGQMNRGLSFHGKKLVLRSEHGPLHTIIDAEHTYKTRVFNFSDGEDSLSVVDGFTVAGGSLNPDHDFPGGAGVYCDQSSPLFRNCVFVDNQTGAGFGSFASSAILENCTFVGNNADYGSAIYTWESHVSVRRCNIVYNQGGAAVAVQNDDTTYALTVDCTNIYANTEGGWDFPFVVANDSLTDVLSFDPEHCNSDLEYQELQETSPLLPLNSPCDELVGAIDSLCHSLGVDSNDEFTVPTEPGILQNHPNPFNAETSIEFSLPRRMSWTVSIYNILGQEVECLSGVSGPGRVTTSWRPESAASGVYFYRLLTDEYVKTRKMLLLK